jgi:hypothetical protein
MIVGLLAGATHMPLHAQETLPPPPEEETPAAAPAQPATAQADDEYDEEIDGEEIVVTGSRPRGSVIGDIPPEQTLTGRDIRAYGAGSLTELLDALAPQTQSGRGRGGGRPITLLNGRRISGFSEIRDIPPEAIARVEILPEEVALKYGYPRRPTRGEHRPAPPFPGDHRRDRRRPSRPPEGAAPMRPTSTCCGSTMRAGGRERRI